MSGKWGDWLEFMVYPLSWVADKVAPELRDAQGGRGCVILLVGAVSLLLWALPPLFLREDALVWLLCVGPLATVAVLAVGVSQFGLLQREAQVEPSADDRDGAAALVERPICGVPDEVVSLYRGECGARLLAASSAKGRDTFPE